MKDVEVERGKEKRKKEEERKDRTCSPNKTLVLRSLCLLPFEASDRSLTRMFLKALRGASACALRAWDSGGIRLKASIRKSRRLFLFCLG